MQQGKTNKKTILIIGAGPAGLTTAYKFSKLKTCKSVLAERIQGSINEVIKWRIFSAPTNIWLNYFIKFSLT